MSTSSLITLSQYHSVREAQRKRQEKPYTDTDRKASEFLYETAKRALEDIAEGREDVSFRVCSMPTGYGKSQSTEALIVGQALHDPEFAAAYVCRERRFAEEVGNGIDALALNRCGHPLATVYTSAHSDARDRVAEESHFIDRYNGFVPQRPLVRKSELKDARVIVVTHETWRSEIEAGADHGVRLYKGRPRLVFVDEQPDLVDIIDLRPEALQAFHDRVSVVDDAVTERLAAIIDKMNALMRSGGWEFSVPKLFQSGDGLMFAMLLDPKKLARYTTLGAPDAVKLREIEEMARVCRFIVAGTQMAAFYAERDKVFWAYEPAVHPGPGTVLLDATADLGPIVSFLPGVERPSAPTPTVNYEPLEVVHVELPKEFGKNAKTLLSKASTGRAYGEWCKRVVAELSPSGAKVLVIAHKAAFDHEYLPRNPETLILEREWVTSHWGAGIGSNEWKDCEYVFLFGEWFPPRGATISEVHGHRRQCVSDAALRLAVGRKSEEGDYLPQGDYRTAHENHLIRWSMQLAARGSVRNIDAEGRCGRMRLVTTMNHTRLLKNIDRMFPGAAVPQSLRIPVDGPSGASLGLPKGREGLIRLMCETDASVIPSKEVERLTGIPSSKLVREFTAVNKTGVADKLGWTLASNKTMGLPKKGTNLVRVSALPPLVEKTERPPAGGLPSSPAEVVHF